MGRYLFRVRASSEYATRNVTTASGNLNDPKISEAALDSEQCYRVRDLTLTREDIRLYFTDGYIVFGKPLAGAPISAVFVRSVQGGDAEMLLNAVYLITQGPGPEGVVNALVHKACLELGITHIESLCNLETLLGQGEFQFIGLPLKWRGATGSNSARISEMSRTESENALARSAYLESSRSR